DIPFASKPHYLDPGSPESASDSCSGDVGTHIPAVSASGSWLNRHHASQSPLSSSSSVHSLTDVVLTLPRPMEAPVTTGSLTDGSRDREKDKERSEISYSIQSGRSNHHQQQHLLPLQHHQPSSSPGNRFFTGRERDRDREKDRDCRRYSHLSPSSRLKHDPGTSDLDADTEPETQETSENHQHQLQQQNRDSFSAPCIAVLPRSRRLLLDESGPYLRCRKRRRSMILSSSGVDDNVRRREHSKTENLEEEKIAKEEVLHQIKREHDSRLVSGEHLNDPDAFLYAGSNDDKKDNEDEHLKDDDDDDADDDENEADGEIDNEQDGDDDSGADVSMPVEDSLLSIPGRRGKHHFSRLRSADGTKKSREEKWMAEVLRRIERMERKQRKQRKPTSGWRAGAERKAPALSDAKPLQAAGTFSTHIGQTDLFVADEELKSTQLACFSGSEEIENIVINKSQPISMGMEISGKSESPASSDGFQKPFNNAAFSILAQAAEAACDLGTLASAALEVADVDNADSDNLSRRKWLQSESRFWSPDESACAKPQAAELDKINVSCTVKANMRDTSAIREEHRSSEVGSDNEENEDCIEEEEDDVQASFEEELTLDAMSSSPTSLLGSHQHPGLVGRQRQSTGSEDSPILRQPSRVTSPSLLNSQVSLEHSHHPQHNPQQQALHKQRRRRSQLAGADELAPNSLGESREDRWLRMQLRRIAQMEQQELQALQHQTQPSMIELDSEIGESRQTRSPSLGGQPVTSCACGDEQPLSPRISLKASTVGPGRRRRSGASLAGPIRSPVAATDLGEPSFSVVSPASVGSFIDYSSGQADPTICTSNLFPTDLETGGSNEHLRGQVVGSPPVTDMPAEETECGLIVYRAREKDPMARFSRARSAAITEVVTKAAISATDATILATAPTTMATHPEHRHITAQSYHFELPDTIKEGKLFQKDQLENNSQLPISMTGLLGPQ
ncbi:unnamed protein product, partial [Protopolystoma xenopodis]